MKIRERWHLSREQGERSILGYLSGGIVWVEGDGRRVFDEMSVRDLGTWNAMISRFCQNGKTVEALDVFRKMCMEGVKIDSMTISSILPVCASLNDLVSGMCAHVYVIKDGLEFDVYVSNALINMYAKFGMLELAKSIFYQVMVRDLVSWNSLIAAYEQNSDPITTLGYFVEMKRNGFQPDILTFVSLASIVAQSRDAEKNVRDGGGVNDATCDLGVNRDGEGGLRTSLCRDLFAGDGIRDAVRVGDGGRDSALVGAVVVTNGNVE
ncbi:hypothetical protein IFM89_030625 [Coptis chinensis]|uniref:Pentatricopeptide repeat-containing protein n=1 Tax=Coptis chinensis TaxID=261450 RepID=A0A835LS08_9MAGN|nr:hypothetical protein IFM89_030625 [Coptis chinensis]